MHAPARPLPLSSATTTHPPPPPHHHHTPVRPDTPVKESCRGTGVREPPVPGPPPYSAPLASAVLLLLAPPPRNEGDCAKLAGCSSGIEGMELAAGCGCGWWGDAECEWGWAWVTLHRVNGVGCAFKDGTAAGGARSQHAPPRPLDWPELHRQAASTPPRPHHTHAPPHHQPFLQSHTPAIHPHTYHSHTTIRLHNHSPTNDTPTPTDPPFTGPPSHTRTPTHLGTRRRCCPAGPPCSAAPSPQKLHGGGPEWGSRQPCAGTQPRLQQLPPLPPTAASAGKQRGAGREGAEECESGEQRGDTEGKQAHIPQASSRCSCLLDDRPEREHDSAAVLGGAALCCKFLCSHTGSERKVARRCCSKRADREQWCSML